MWFTVPTMGLITLAALGIGVSRACCGLKVSRHAQFRVVPVVLGVITSSIAMFTYFAPRPDKLFDRIGPS
ncbi:MAG: hypothetical protein ACFCVE_03450 [Phycisphaerae bacterium]